MKRVILTFVLLFSTLSVLAWNKLSFATIMEIASKHLTAEAASAAKQTLGKGFAENSIASYDKYNLWLDENFHPLCNGASDALVVAEQCVERIKADRDDGEAILLLAKAISDMHNVAYVRIRGNQLTNADFAVRRWNNREGRSARYNKVTWGNLWNHYYANRHDIFTPALYAYDIELCQSDNREAFVKGNLSDWAADMGEECRTIYTSDLAEGKAFRQEEINEFEYMHERLMAKSGYRLAEILNRLLK